MFTQAAYMLLKPSNKIGCTAGPFVHCLYQLSQCIIYINNLIKTTTHVGYFSKKKYQVKCTFLLAFVKSMFWLLILMDKYRNFQQPHIFDTFYTSLFTFLKQKVQSFGRARVANPLSNFVQVHYSYTYEL